ncbi:tripartite tricarboxylate transporter permease [Devosia sp. YIM 151766]|uniref:tripartite tricarboxylate transporter permease n=1 Tax=Devosia sp. YIM 151766 TaxID=3017325 RepID=UPI00255CB15C|nr:tripartite tricarboxylate transporter permease [Devosia sp. YIM 151766]WIY52732.1 tripartite tricarboxylate transporter permease [Devosia sp. YIM 151766]
METLSLFLGGFATVLQPSYLGFALIGCILGTMVGVLPGIGPAAGTAILIPITAVMDPTGSIIMLAAIYYGAMYGGTITSVLINTPGEAASAVTCLDGYQMAKQGRAGPALAVAAIGSFIGGMIATIGLVVLALPLTKLALTFGPPEIFALLIVGLAFVTALANQSMVRAMIAAVLGMLIAQVGIDPIMGTGRYTFGTPELYDGFDIVAVIMGLFGLGEILTNAEARARGVFAHKVSSVYLSREDMKASAAPIARGTLIGFPLGLIPGLGSMIPTFLSYAVEKRLSKTPEKFGTGMIEGVAGPETANNAYANAAMIPLFTLGIPSSPTIAVLMGAFMINGLIPGPSLFIEHSEFVWAVIASLVVGNAILLVLNLPLIPLWVQLLKVPYPILVTIIVVFCIIGVYSLNNSVFDIWVALAFGVAGYLLRKLDIPVAPLVLTLVLTPMIERALRQSLEMSNGNFGIFFERPLALTLLSVALAALLLSSLRVFRKVQADSEI